MKTTEIAINNKKQLNMTDHKYFSKWLNMLAEHAK